MQGPVKVEERIAIFKHCDGESSVSDYMKKRILAVIVLYKLPAGQSPSLSTLLKAKQRVSPGALDLAIVLHDNTPGPVLMPELPNGVFYFHDGTNDGLAKAYNRALLMAIKHGYEWLLTLDQDTVLPEDTLRVLLHITDKLDQRLDVAAIAPQITSDGCAVSPNYFAGGGWPRWFPTAYTGIPECPIFAFNSASLLRVSALRQIGGYSPWFWFDNCDSYLYRRLAKYGKRVYVAGEIQVSHDFSMKDMHNRVSPDRYRAMLLAESAFWDLEMNCLAGLERTLRLAARMLKHWYRNDNPELRQITLAALLSRLVHSRKHRIAEWRGITEKRLGCAPETPFAQQSLRISVCMAAHNGSKFILPQLRSIAPQLSSKDEIVIVDDASRDDTLTLIRQFQRELLESEHAPRIVVLEQDQNLGLVRSFERTVRSATGDIVFLSDQDDLWVSGKVDTVIGEFSAHPETQLVATNFQLIDEHGQMVMKSSLLNHRRFSTSFFANLIHNQFQGATIAFRSSLVHSILPFPKGKLFLHDRWIGVCAILARVAIRYIDEPLILYRCHPNNITQPFSRWKQIRLRIELCGSLLRRAIYRV